MPKNQNGGNDDGAGRSRLRVILAASIGSALEWYGFVVRPLGGVVFGIMGDRFGRKPVLVATLLMIGIGTTAIGLLPTYAQIGYWAPALLVAA